MATGALEPSARGAERRASKGIAGGSLFALAHHGLLIVLDADLRNQIDLRFQPVDVFFRIVENLHEDLTRDEIANRFAIGDGFLARALRNLLELKVALEDFAEHVQGDRKS